jgi:hypothetical protein
MIQDPRLCWDGEFPYEALAAAGITPHSTQDEVRRANFDLMRKRALTPQARQAWDELRDPERRMIADFLLYDLDADAEIAASAEAARRALEALGDPHSDGPPVRALTATSDMWEDPDTSRLLPAAAGSSIWDLGAFVAAALPDSLITFDR